MKYFISDVYSNTLKELSEASYKTTLKNILYIVDNDNVKTFESMAESTKTPIIELSPDDAIKVMDNISIYT